MLDVFFFMLCVKLPAVDRTNKVTSLLLPGVENKGAGHSKLNDSPV